VKAYNHQAIFIFYNLYLHSPRVGSLARVIDGVSGVEASSSANQDSVSPDDRTVLVPAGRAGRRCGVDPPISSEKRSALRCLGLTKTGDDIRLSFVDVPLVEGCRGKLHARSLGSDWTFHVVGKGLMHLSVGARAKLSSAKRRLLRWSRLLRELK
jgi:hypothetical protein